MDKLYYILRNNVDGWTLVNHGDSPHDSMWTSDPLRAKKYSDQECKDFMAMSAYICSAAPANDAHDFKHLLNLMRLCTCAIEYKEANQEPVLIMSIEHFKKHTGKPSRVILGAWDENISSTLKG